MKKGELKIVGKNFRNLLYRLRARDGVNNRKRLTGLVSVQYCRQIEDDKAKNRDMNIDDKTINLSTEGG